MDKLFAVLKLLPAIVAAIKSIEEMLPGVGKGEQKLAALRELMESLDSSITNLWPQIAGVVAIVVKFMNANGWTK